MQGQQQFKDKAIAKQNKAAEQKKQEHEKELARKAEKAEREKKEREELARLFKEEEAFALLEADRTRDLRRMETLARFLETRIVSSTGEEIRDKTNVCVAIAEFKGKIIATTNRGQIGKLIHKGDTLYIEESFTVEKEEQDVATSARKLSAWSGADAINKVEQVAMEKSDNMHAEMKMIDFLFGDMGVTFDVTIYISRLCCAKCRKAIDLWNGIVKAPGVRVRDGTHGGYFPGWDPPNVFLGHEALCDRLFVLPKSIEAQLGKKEEEEVRGRQPFSEYASVTSLPQRRDRSLSPAPKEGKFGYL